VEVWGFLSSRNLQGVWLPKLFFRLNAMKVNQHQENTLLQPAARHV
jgi:hypothetical protein